jgi:hypothetical protein
MLSSFNCSLRYREREKKSKLDKKGEVGEERGKDKRP